MSYSKAISQYKKSLNRKETTEAREGLANAFRLSNDVDNAEIEYAQIVNNPKSSIETQYYYARILMEKGQYTLARIHLIEYLKVVPDDVVARMLLSSCNSVTDRFRDTTLFSLKEINLPQLTASFSAVPYKNGYVFSGDKLRRIMQKENPWTGRSYLDLYFLEKDQSGKWLTPTLLKGDINGQYHEGPATFTKDGNRVYFTRSNYYKFFPRKNSKNENTIKIFQADLKDGKWNTIKELPFNSDEYSTGHPSLTPDGKTLYFVSDMPGGYGGLDIYYSELTDDTWTKPKNLGSSVNTPGNEMFPYFYEDGSLYFSSDAHNSMGGLDVFVTSFDGTKWLRPENLNYPLNSNKDDFGFVMNGDKKSGMVSSSRTFKDAIYEFKKNDPKFNLIVTVRREKDRKPLKDAKVEIMNWNSGKRVSLATDADGKTVQRLELESDFLVAAAKDGFFAKTAETSTKNKKYSEDLYLNLFLDELVIEKPIVLQNIYYDLDKWEIRPDAAKELNLLVKVMEDNPKISIELSSHTDSRAGDQYNLILSDKRAKAAVNYLISKGIAASRMTWKGYGESKLLNRCKNNVACSEEEHQLNRRTEFKVTKVND